MRELVGYLRFDTEAELPVLNRDLGPRPDLHQLPAGPAEARLKQRHGAKVTKSYDRAATPFGRDQRPDRITAACRTDHAQDYGQRPPRRALPPDPGPLRPA